MASLHEIGEQTLGESDLLDTDKLTVRDVFAAFVFHLIPGWLLRSAAPSGLLAVPWVRALIDQPGDFEQALDFKQLTQKGGTFSEDHLLKNMGRRGMLRDNKVLYSPSRELVHNIYHLSGDVSGHKGVAHGGLVATLIDESFGYVLYLGKQHKTLEFNVVLTARLEVDYKAPMPAGSIVCCTASLEKREGPRKLWVRAELRSEPGEGGTLFAVGRALFVVPRPQALPGAPPN